MSDVVVQIDGPLKNIIDNPKFKYIKDYVNILAETGEFSAAIADLEREIVSSIEDSKITKNEIRKISVKMFHVIKLLFDKKFKFKSLNEEKSRQLKDLLSDHMHEILTYLVVTAVDALKKKNKNFDIIGLNEEDIELIVGTIVDTAEWAINLTPSNWFSCCH